jgi:hypothetical protein
MDTRAERPACGLDLASALAIKAADDSILEIIEE